MNLRAFLGARERAIGLAAAASVSLFAPGSGQAEGDSGWVAGPQSAVRLIAVAPEGDRRTVRAGVEIKLDAGFKTYWRTPGDAGVPPRFDWSASDNVASVEVRWPAPERFADAGGFSIGYHESVLFPLVVTTERPDRPSRLALKLDYAVCEKLCIPAQAAVTLPVPARTDTRIRAVLEGAEARVPLSARLGAASAGMTVKEISASSGEGRGEVRAVVAISPGTEVRDVFAEAPGLWVFGKPRIESGTSGETTAHIPVEDRPKELPTEALALTLTIVSSIAAIELKTGLDVKPLAR